MGKRIYDRVSRFDLTGLKFGMLTVESREGSDKHGKAVYKVRCDCGNEKLVLGASMVSGRVVSCGCYHSKQLKAAHAGKTICKPDSEKGIYEHKQRMMYDQDFGWKARLYNVWKSMRNRCSNPKDKSYGNYGGRGIRVCKEWNDSFIAFATWAYANGYDKNTKYGECTIDRIDVNGNYEPDNCRFVSIAEQNANKR